MGVNCSCNNNIVYNNEINVKNQEKLNQLSIYFFNNISASIVNSDPKMVMKLIKVQAYFKSYLTRKRVNNQLMLSRTKYSTDRYITYKVIDKCPEITYKDIQLLFAEFPKLDEFSEVILKSPVEYSNKAIYYGEWDINTGKRSGRGILNWPDGSRYEGYWRNDKANLRGRLFHKHKDIYEGEWIDDKANGWGVYIHKDGARYEGSWVDDKQEGEGKEIWPDGSVFVGEFRNGKKNGRGRFKWSDGSEFEGELVDNNIEGMGKYIWNDNRQYNGFWKNNKMEGEGYFIWPDGRKYQGGYKDDKKHGLGIFEWSDGRKYCGQWLNGVQHGEGEFYHPLQNNWKRGIWDNGKLEKLEEKD